MLRFVWTLALCAIGCSSSSTPNRCPDDEAACFDDFLVAACRAEIERGRYSGGFGFEPPCNQYAAPVHRRLRDAIERGDVGFRIDEAMRCLAEERIGVTRCFDAWEPRVAAGGACDHDLECDDGLCAPEEFARSRPHWALGPCGVCIPRVLEGGACGFTGWDGRVCADGLNCRSSGGMPEQTCFRPLTRGSACSGFGECAEGLHCFEGSCQDDVALGAACDPDERCAGRNVVCMALCDATGLPCEDTPCSGTCNSECTEGFRDHGRECDHDEHCLGRCEAGTCITAGPGEPCESGKCAPGSACDGTTCRAVVALGESCNTTRPCAPGGVCDSGECRELRLFDESCDDTTRCVEGFDCLDGVCTLAGLLGDDCTQSCRSGTCVDGICSTPAEGTVCTFLTSECGQLVCDETCQPAGDPDLGCSYDEYIDFFDPSAGCVPICYLGV